VVRSREFCKHDLGFLEETLTLFYDLFYDFVVASMSDPGYANLLNHLHRSTSLSLQAAQSSIAYYLAHAQPSPTPLAASVVGSSLFKPFSNEKLDAVGKAFRHAVHIKMSLLEKEETSVFLRSLDARMGGWVRGVMKGLQGSQAMIHLASSAGLLLGLEDFEQSLKMRNGRVRNNVEAELVVALAEVLDLYSSLRGSADWENEFHPDTEVGGAQSLRDKTLS
jgi:hypothetical protein